MKAAIFDLDGTLVDSNDLHAQAWQETFRHFGREIPYSELRRQIGKGGDQYLPVFLSERELEQIGSEMDKFRADLFKEKYLERVRPFPKVKELFERVRKDGKRVALASSGNDEEVAHYVKLAGLDGLFDAQTTKSNVKHFKPSPDVFTSALQLLDVPADEAIAIGDTPYDVQAAKKIRLQSIALLCGGFNEGELRASGAVAIFRDPAALLSSYKSSVLFDSQFGANNHPAQFVTDKRFLWQRKTDGEKTDLA
ncbi:MAG: HAD family phosphatase [Chthoniobacterales bacterium]|nr:HAD family phosphatase [Chthoniobacterales bacterium]